MILLAGPFTGAWREADLAAQRLRRSPAQQARLEELEQIGGRTAYEETEFLTLSWFTDHADRDRAWEWGLAAARTTRPVNYAMNAQLNAVKRLDTKVDELRSVRPARTVIIGGAGDSRPADALRRLGARLGCDVFIIEKAGHFPWLEAPQEFGSLLRAAL